MIIVFYALSIFKFFSSTFVSLINDFDSSSVVCESFRELKNQVKRLQHRTQHLIERYNCSKEAQIIFDALRNLVSNGFKKCFSKKEVLDDADCMLVVPFVDGTTLLGLIYSSENKSLWNEYNSRVRRCPEAIDIWTVSGRYALTKAECPYYFTRCFPESVWQQVVDEINADFLILLREATVAVFNKLEYFFNRLN